MKRAGQTTMERAFRQMKEAACERFKSKAAVRRFRNKHFEVTEYEGRNGLVLRIEAPRLVDPAPNAWRVSKPPAQQSWYIKRQGRPFELCAYWLGDARAEVRRIDDGDEETLRRAYLANRSGGQDCYYYHESDLLQELTLEQLKDRIAEKKGQLAACEHSSARRGLVDVIWPLKREIRALEKTFSSYTDWMKREGLKIQRRPERAETRRIR